MRSLADKMDKPEPLMRTQQEYQGGKIIFPLRHGCRDDSNTSVLRLKTIGADGDCRQKGNSKGGGLQSNNRWCNPGHLAEKERLCTPDVELLAVFLSMLSTERVHLCYLPVHRPVLQVDDVYDVTCVLNHELSFYQALKTVQYIHNDL